MSLVLWVTIALVLGVLALVGAAIAAAWVVRQATGTEEMRQILELTMAGAVAFLRRPDNWLFWAALVLSALIAGAGALFDIGVGWQTAVSFFIGAMVAGLAGHLSTLICIRSNARTAHAARSSMAAALQLAFRGASVAGLILGGLSLVAVSAIWLIFRQGQWITGFALGTAGVALLYAVAGGIHAKAVDVGADFFSFPEATVEGIVPPGLDAHSPAEMADKVGDNVIHVTVVGTSILASGATAVMAAVSLGALLLDGGPVNKLTVLPLLLAAAGLLASAVAGLLVKARGGERITRRSLSLGVYAAAVLVLGAAAALVFWFLPGSGEPWHTYQGFVWCIAAGLAGGLTLGELTSIYTSESHQPVRRLAEVSGSAQAFNIMRGLGMGMSSVTVPVLVLGAVLALSFFLAELTPLPGAGLYGVALAAVAMLTTLVAYMTLSALGPILEVADEIAQMTDLPAPIQARTDLLAYAGRRSAAQARGYATGSAAFASLAGVLAFGETYRVLSGRVAVLTVLGSPSLILGLLLGAALPFLLSSLMTDAVGRTVGVVVGEVERQFREIPGLAEGDAQPDAATCVGLVTEKVKKETVVPCLLAVLIPLVVGVVSPAALAGLLLGALGSGFVLSIALGNAGGAWKGARKYIEGGGQGGRGSPSHLAAAAGDMVGHYLRDASSPALNSLLTVMSAIALAFAPLFASLHGA